MATPNVKIMLSGLARRLVQDGLLSENEAQRAYDQSTKNKIPFVTYLVQSQILGSREIASAATVEFGVCLFDLDALDFDMLPKNLVDEKLIRQHHALPLFKRGSRLFIAVSDPANLQALDEIKFHTGGLNTEAVLAEEDKLTDAIEKALESRDTGMEGLIDEDLDDLEITAGDEAQEEAPDLDAELDEAPVVKFVKKVLLDAIKRGASDVHFEPYEKNYRVRYRMDGVLCEMAAPPINLGGRITARIKVMSRLDVSERRIPQDGRMKMGISKNRAIDFRVSTCPTLFGEKVVVRLLDPSSAKMGIDALGYEEEQKRLFLEAILRPQGMVLVTGPTGSGKTVSLYTALNILNTAERNISTAEDPAEINLPGVNQVNVNPKVGLDFSSALRSFLRQDPDIIMVGEIRDLETAEIAIKAAQTGHMVLSTLHTNSAPETLTRLANMGVPAYNIAASVNLIIAQRLGRRLCSRCKKPQEIPDHILLEAGFQEHELPELKIFGPVGCERCNGGYKGRVGIYQVMPISAEMQKLILAGGSGIQIAEQARKEGIQDLRGSGLNKVKQGITSLEEVHRITTE
jgi:type IV pilus assembly protein PilB